jgi:hypothetical protein
MKYQILRLGEPTGSDEVQPVVDLMAELSQRMPKAGHLKADEFSEIEVVLCVSLPSEEHQPIAEGMGYGKPTVVLERVHWGVPGPRRWIVRPVNIREEASIALDTAGAIGRTIDVFSKVGRAPNDRLLRIDVEAFVHGWSRAAPLLALSPDDRRIGDALAQMAAELVKVDEPPRSVLQAAFAWFAAKADRFTDEAATEAGKWFGRTAGIGASVAVSGHMSDLTALLDKVLAHLQ